MSTEKGVTKSKKTKPEENAGRKEKTGKLRNKLLLIIVPVVAVAIAVVELFAINMSRNSMTEMAQNELESSISNQADNIESWLDENLQNFATAKRTVEKSELSKSQLQNLIDGYYGFNTNSPNGLYIGYADGTFLKAADSTKTESDVVNSDWYKQGITRVEIAYGPFYTNSDGENVITASGMLDNGASQIQVIAADVTLDKISIIVNSGVVMDDASSFLIDTSDNTILAHKDASRVSTKLETTDSDALMSGVAAAIADENYDTSTIADNMVSYNEISGTDWVLVSYIPEKIILASVTQLGNIITIIGIIAVILLSIIISMVISKLIAPISDITNSISAMSEGDFTISSSNASNDEIGLISRKVAEFTKSMRGMISSIDGESKKLMDQSATSDTVAKSMFNASKAQAEAMSELNDTVDQLAAAVNDIAQNATSLSNIVADAKENSDKASTAMKETVTISQKGRSDMQQLSTAMGQIQDSNGSLVDSINKVGKASEEITNIVGLIGDIAEETNLLSLNASIEAARAGESGRGFAVVATQIGKLAQTSAESAQNISKLIDDVNNLIKESVSRANDSAESINANTVMIETAVNTFEQIYKNIEQSDEMVGEMIQKMQQVDDVATNVAAISEEQAASADEILATSQNMVEQSNSITDSSQEVADNSQELSETSNTLTDYVQKFKI